MKTTGAALHPPQTLAFHSQGDDLPLPLLFPHFTNHHLQTPTSSGQSLYSLITTMITLPTPYLLMDPCSSINQISFFTTFKYSQLITSSFWLFTTSSVGEKHHVATTSTPTSVPVRVAHELLQAGHHYLDVRYVLTILSFFLLLTYSSITYLHSYNHQLHSLLFSFTFFCTNATSIFTIQFTSFPHVLDVNCVLIECSYHKPKIIIYFTTKFDQTRLHKKQ